MGLYTVGVISSITTTPTTVGAIPLTRIAIPTPTIATLGRGHKGGTHQAATAASAIGTAGIISHTLGKFFRDYVINLGFLDGACGVISVGMHAYYTFWKYAKLWELNQLKRLGKPIPLPKLDEEQERWELPWMKNGAQSPVPSAQSRPPRT